MKVASKDSGGTPTSVKIIELLAKSESFSQ